MKFKNVDYSSPDVKERLYKLSQEQKRIVRESEITMHELESINFPYYPSCNL
jgi:hypothetical protein